VYRPLAEDGVVRMLIGAAGAAPSIHNTQPWRFRVTGDLIEVHGDPGRMLWVADPRGRALHLSCGAALFNLRLAIRMLAAKPLVWPLPDPQHEPTLLASVQLQPSRPATSAEREMFEMIGQRHSSRAPFSSHPIPDAVQIELEQQAGSESALLRLLNDRDAALVLELAAAVERPAGHYEPRPRLAVLSTARDEPGDWLRAGQALQRVLLTATRSGLATSLLYQPVERHDTEHQGHGWWPWPECPQVIIRFGYGPRGTGTPRRGVEDILG
jgi:nitroreductase